MRVIGMISTAIVAAGVIVAGVAGVRSMEDIKRYLRMRQM